MAATPEAATADLMFRLGFRDVEGPGRLLAGYLRHVANGGLCRYKVIFQTGAKAGVPVYVHFLNGVLTAERLRPLLDLSDIETRVLYSAYSVHDINKVAAEDGSGAPRSFNRLAEPCRIQTELEAVGVPGFFPAYRDYLADITLLVRQHSAHYASGGEFLVPAHDPYRLPRARLADVLIPLMRALDILDLSTTLEEAQHKHAFLQQIHRVTARRYTWVTHRVTEQRGLLTNVVHNAVVEYLSERFDLLALAFYPEGVAYLADAAHRLTPGPADRVALGAAVVDALSRKSRRDFAQFIRSGPSGIVVGRECLDAGVSFPDILRVILNLVARRAASKSFRRIAEIEAKVREHLQAGTGDRTAIVGLGSRLASAHLVPPTQEGMAAGELLRAYYIFLVDHGKGRVPAPWPAIYQAFGLCGEDVAFFDLVEPRYQRAYVMAQSLGLELEPLYEHLLRDGTTLFGSGPMGSVTVAAQRKGTRTGGKHGKQAPAVPPPPDSGDGEPADDVSDADVAVPAGDLQEMAAYTEAVVRLDFGSPPVPDFGAALRRYLSDDHRQLLFDRQKVLRLLGV